MIRELSTRRGIHIFLIVFLIIIMSVASTTMKSVSNTTYVAVKVGIVMNMITWFLMGMLSANDNKYDHFRLIISNFLKVLAFIFSIIVFFTGGRNISKIELISIIFSLLFINVIVMFIEKNEESMLKE